MCFFSGNSEYYEEIKQLIIEWIENNYEDYLEFFGADEANNLPRDYFAKKELDYIKSKNSWGSHYTIAISCLLFNLDIALYVKENQTTYKRLNFFNRNNKQRGELCIMTFHDNNHFEIIYSKHVNINNVCIVKKIKDIPINKN